MAYVEKTNDYSIVSRLKYPFEIQDDSDLTRVFHDRLISGTLGWIEDTKESRFISPTQECCGNVCEIIPAPKRSNKCILFSINGNSYIYSRILFGGGI